METINKTDLTNVLNNLASFQKIKVLLSLGEGVQVSKVYRNTEDVLYVRETELPSWTIEGNYLIWFDWKVIITVNKISAFSIKPTEYIFDINDLYLNIVSIENY